MEASMAVPSVLSKLGDYCHPDELVQLVGEMCSSIPAAKQQAIAYLRKRAFEEDVAADRRRLTSFKQKLSAAAKNARSLAYADSREDCRSNYHGHIDPLNESQRMMEAIAEVKGSVKGSVTVRMEMMCLLMEQMVLFEMEEGADGDFEGNELAKELDQQMVTILEELEDLPPLSPAKECDGSWSASTLALLRKVEDLYCDEHLKESHGALFEDIGMAAGGRASLLIRKAERAVKDERDAVKRPTKRVKRG